MAASPFEEKAMHVPCWYSTHLHVVFPHLIESYSVQLCYCSFNEDMLLDGIYPDRAFNIYTCPNIACSKCSYSGEQCKVKKAMKSRRGLGREVQERL